MSYDFEFFKMKPGTTPSEIQSYLQSEQYNVYLNEMLEMEEEDDDFEYPPVPYEFVDVSIDEYDLKGLIGKAFLRIIVPDQKRTEELNEYFDTKDDFEPPDEYEEILDHFFMYSGVEGFIPINVPYGENLESTLMVFAYMLEILQPEGILIYDPQEGIVIDGSNAKEIMKESAAKAMDYYTKAIESMKKRL